MNIIEKPSPNFDSRDGQPVDMLVLHYTGMRTAAEALERLCDATAKVSAHYMVDEDGIIYRLVSEEMRAWHAGVSSWRGNDNINQRSIGIEIVNPGHEFGYRPFPQAQMDAVAKLCKDILSRHPIPARNVVAHSDVAPQRKEDPGELFNWPWLAGQGVGLWPVAGNKAIVWLRWAIRALYITFVMNRSPEARKPQAYRWQYCKKLFEHPTVQKLRLVGYGFLFNGDDINESNQMVFKAFQRHYRPRNINGLWDAECQTLLDALLKIL